MPGMMSVAPATARAPPGMKSTCMSMMRRGVVFAGGQGHLSSAYLVACLGIRSGLDRGSS